MAASAGFQGRRRARRGSLERPVNGRMYRGTWLLVGLPLLGDILNRLSRQVDDTLGVGRNGHSQLKMIILKRPL